MGCRITKIARVLSRDRCRAIPSRRGVAEGRGVSHHKPSILRGVSHAQVTISLGVSYRRTTTSWFLSHYHTAVMPNDNETLK